MGSEAVSDIESTHTLDEATIRYLFPEAPADTSVPKDVRSLFKAQLREFRERRGAITIGAIIATLLLAAAALGSGHPILAGVVMVILICVLGGIGIWQHSIAADAFFDRYAAARGLSHVESGNVPGNVPLLGRGDRRKFPRVMSGHIAGEAAQLAHYTYTEISQDSEGNESQTDYDFTILRTALPPQVAGRYTGVYLSPRKLSLGKLQDKLAHDRKVELESVDFAKRYTLRVVDAQDDIALYELFSPTFIEHLATNLKVYWEQRGGDIVFWMKGHESEASDLDEFVQRSEFVLRRYREEWR